MASKFRDRAGKFHLKPRWRCVRRRVSVYGIAEKNGKILLVKPMWKEEFELPGGGQEKKEKIPEALKREFLEETGFSIKLLADLPVKTRTELFYADDIDEYYISRLLFFLVKIVGSRRPSLVHSQEIREIHWCNRYDLNNRDINKSHLEVLREVFKSHKEGR